MKNEIMEEVWRIRDAFAKKHRYDIDAMVSALQKMEQHPHSRMVDRRNPAPNRSMQAAK